MTEEEDKVLDQEQWKLEARAVIGDVKRHVAEIKLSEKLESTDQFIYLNLTTLEGSKFCVQLSGAGFSVVGDRHDDASNAGNEHFETPYSLLDSVSPQYRNSFGSLLLDKLKKLGDEQ